jgi:hypothetical protein
VGMCIFSRFYGWLILAGVMCLMGMVHFCVLSVYVTTFKLVIYYLADFVHIWYNGWV